MSLPHVMLVNGSLFGGGAEQVIATLARHLRSGGHRVTIAVIHRGGEVQADLIQEGFDVVTEIATQAGRGSSSRHLMHLIADRGVDVAHSHDLRSLIDVGLCRLRSRAFAHLHTFHFGNYPWVPWKHLLMEGLVSRVPDQLVAVGHRQRESITKAFRLSPHRVQTIWNGVDYVLRPMEFRTTDVRPRIGSVSTFGLQKGLPTLLEAARILKDRGLPFRLVLVGEGSMRRELEATTASLGLDDEVEFTGWKADAAATYLPTFDIFVQSSYWEAMSVVILEAMAARRPIVATRVGENTSVLTHDETAILVPAKSAEALADGLGRMLTEPGLAARLGANAQAVYRERFTGQAMALRYAQAYRACLKQRGLATATGSSRSPLG